MIDIGLVIAVSFGVCIGVCVAWILRLIFTLCVTLLTLGGKWTWRAVKSERSLSEQMLRVAFAFCVTMVTFGGGKSRNTATDKMSAGASETPVGDKAAATSAAQA